MSADEIKHLLEEI